MATIIDLVIWKFKDFNTGKITPKRYYMDAYVEELFESDMSLLPLNYYIQF